MHLVGYLKNKDRSQVGIGTLIVFIAMVLVAAIASGVLINTAELLQTQAEATGEEASAQVTDRLQVQSVIADTNTVSQPGTADAEITTLNLTIKKAPGSGDINMSEVTINIISDGVQKNLVHNESLEIGDDLTYWEDSFRTEAITDSNPDIITDNSNRLKLSIGLLEIGGLGPTDPDAELQEGDTVTIEISTASGGTTYVEKRAPRNIVGGDVYKL